MKTGNYLIQLGFGLLFIWGGIEKFIEGFMGGVGLENMAALLMNNGLSFLGESGAIMLSGVLAFLELIAGILLVINKKIFYSYTFLAFIMLMALIIVHIPSGNWMNIMIHIALLLALSGLAINTQTSTITKVQA
ncbi:DoxX family membrane protein [Joostella atrarenae]|uniref:DoxX family membrane protein n=1 Tax=Joostella atrarenae TaxID=679257 RepID=A0ABS9J3S4_9FLAO|nr:doxX family protein [Joostella atrarenae]MCF8715082.1 DoxX family membrane protein [Joostella atrarenae]